MKCDESREPQHDQDGKETQQHAHASLSDESFPPSHSPLRSPVQRTPGISRWAHDHLPVQRSSLAYDSQSLFCHTVHSLICRGPQCQEAPSYGHRNPCHSQPGTANHLHTRRESSEALNNWMSAGSFSPKQSGANHRLPRRPQGKEPCARVVPSLIWVRGVCSLRRHDE